MIPVAVLTLFGWSITRTILFPLCFLFFMVFPMFFVNDPDYGTFEVKGQRWVKVSINGLPGVYGPIVNKNLRRGVYNISWVAVDNAESNIVSIKKGQTFLLNP